MLPPGLPKPKHMAPSSHHSSRPPLTNTGGTSRMVTEGHSYSAVAESASELRLPGKGSDSAGINSSHSHLGTNSSSLSQTSSQELHAVQGTDMDSANPKRGWSSQEESGLLSLSGENSYLEKGQVSATLEEGSQESLGPEEEEREGQQMDLVVEEGTVQVCWEWVWCSEWVWLVSRLHKMWPQKLRRHRPSLRWWYQHPQHPQGWELPLRPKPSWTLT